MKSKEEIAPYAQNIALGVTELGISRRTLVRWLEHYGLYITKPKLTDEQAKEIRKLHDEGATRKQLADRFEITVAAIGRIINNIHHRIEQDTAMVSVNYNVRS